MKKFYLIISVLFIFNLLASKPHESPIFKEFKGLKKYSHKMNYSKSITDIYLAYDENNNVIKGAAFKKFKSYKKITGLIIIEKTNDGYKIIKADIPDINVIKEEKQKNKLTYTLKDFFDKLIKPINKDFIKVDAVTGATKYHKITYTNFNLLAKKLIQEMENNPNWEKKAL